MARELLRHLKQRPYLARFAQRFPGFGAVSPPALTSLVGWYRADGGFTEVTGKVSQWDDMSGNGNHLTQGTAANRFTAVTNRRGVKSMRATRSAATNMTVPSGMAWNARSCSLFMVVTQSTRNIPLKSIVHFGGLGTDGEDAAIQNRNLLVAGFDGAAKTSAIRFGNVNTLLGMTSGASATTLYNYGQSEAITQFLAQSGTGGSKIGTSTNPTTLGADGHIHEVFIYDKELDAGEILLLESYCQARWGAGGTKSNYVFFDGDSHTEGSSGVDLTNDFYWVHVGDLVNWPFNGWCMPDGPTQTAATRDVAAGTVLDPSIDGTRNNIVSIFVGGNDLLSVSVATAIANLSTYVSNRRTAGADKIICYTLPDRADVASATLASFNTTLRGETFYDELVDLAADSRFQDATDTTYYDADAIHLTALGQEVIAELLAPKLSSVLVP